MWKRITASSSARLATACASENNVIVPSFVCDSDTYACEVMLSSWGSLRVAIGTARSGREVGLSMLIHCSECSHKCSDKADKCTNCGHPLKAPPRPEDSAKVVVRFVVVFVVIFAFLSMFTSVWGWLVDLMVG